MSAKHAAKRTSAGGRARATPWRRLRGFVRSRLTWSRIYRATSYLKSALWTVPLIAVVLELALAPAVRGLDEALHWRVFGYGVEGAKALYQTVITLTLSFLVFTFGSLLVAIQVAGGQLTPRIIATALLRDNVVRGSVGLFTFTLFLAVGSLNWLGATVDQGVALITALLGLACVVVFLFLIDYAARLLRPVSILARIGDEGIAVIEAVYPLPTTERSGEASAPWEVPNPPSRDVAHEGRSQSLLAVDVATLVAMARRRGGVVEIVPQVGDFVATGDSLFVLHGGATALDDDVLRSTVAFGPERTLEQDPMFAFRIVVDIALKALSPAINDPTTAVIAIDQVQRMLRMVGRRHLRGEVIPDGAGHPRTILRTPNWEDFVNIACTEIRACGAGSVQVARRQRAMLENLIASLPEHRHAALRTQLDLLDRAVRTLYEQPEELALSRVADPQGIGASSSARACGPG